MFCRHSINWNIRYKFNCRDRNDSVTQSFCLTLLCSVCDATSWKQTEALFHRHSRLVSLAHNPLTPPPPPPPGYSTLSQAGTIVVLLSIAIRQLPIRIIGLGYLVNVCKTYTRKIQLTVSTPCTDPNFINEIFDGYPMFNRCRVQAF